MTRAGAKSFTEPVAVAGELRDEALEFYAAAGV